MSKRSINVIYLRDLFPNDKLSVVVNGFCNHANTEEVSSPYTDYLGYEQTSHYIECQDCGAYRLPDEYAFENEVLADTEPVHSNYFGKVQL